MRWSVNLQAEGDRVLTHDEVVELADAVAGASGIASGIGTSSYGVQLLVEADDRASAVEQGRAIFTAAAERAQLPPWPVVLAEAISELEDEDDYFAGRDLPYGTE